MNESLRVALLVGSCLYVFSLQALADAFSDATDVQHSNDAG